MTPEFNGWPDLLPGLSGAAVRGDLPEPTRAASLTSMGYLLQELDECSVSPLSQEEVNQALTAIHACMLVPSVLICRAAVNALHNALPFAASIFEDDGLADERNAVMDAVVSAASASDPVIVAAAFQCIARIADLYYPRLEGYMKPLTELTSIAATSPDESIATGALDFWASIAEEEARRRREGDEEGNKKYTQRALGPLVEMVFNIMCSVDEDTHDKEYGPVEAASSVLKNAALAVGPVVVDAVMPFINANIVDEDWRKRDAAVMAFALILEDSVHDEAAQRKLRAEVVRPALLQLLGKLVGPTRDAHPVVRSSTAFALSVVFEFHIDVIDPVPDTPVLLDALCGALDDAPVAAKFVAMALNNLVSSLDGEVAAFVTVKAPKTEEPVETILTPFFYPVINALMLRADAVDADQHELRQECYEAISTVIEAAAQKDKGILLAFLDNCIQRISESLGRPAATIAARDYEYTMQEKLIGMMNSILTKLEEEAARVSDLIIAIVVQILQAPRHPATPEALMAACHLARHVVGDGFARYMPAMFPLLLAGMRGYQDAKTCERSIMATADIALAMGTAFLPSAADVLDILHALLLDDKVVRALKPPAIDALGDIALSVGAAIEPRLPLFLFTIYTAAKQPVPTDDEELQEYVTEVRRSCMACYSSFFQAFIPEELHSTEGGHAHARKVIEAREVAIRALGAQALPQLYDVIAQYANEWSEGRKADASFAPDYALLRKAVSCIGDATLAVGHDAVSPFFTLRSDVVQFVTGLEAEQWAIHRGEDDEDDSSEKPHRDFVLTVLPP